MKGKARADRLRNYVDALLRSNVYDRLIGNRFFQGTLVTVTAHGQGYLCQLQRVGDSGVDGNTYLCVTPGYVPFVGDVVECVWRDSNVGYVLWPVTGSRNLIGVQQFASTTLTAVSSLVTVASGLPTYGFRHLELFVTARGDNATTSISGQLQYNGDQNNNYEWTRMATNGSVVAASESGGALVGSITGWLVTAASSPTGWTQVVRIWIPNYLTPDYMKTCLINGGGQNNAALPAATSSGNEQVSGQWNSLAPITSVEISASAGNFVVGSTFDAYLWP